MSCHLVRNGCNHVIVRIGSLVLGLWIAWGSARADVIGLEDLTPTMITALGTGQYWNGSDLFGPVVTDTTSSTTYATSFRSGGASFNNSYTWWKSYHYGSWTGWAFSDVSDTTTAGVVNQYAAFPGDGADGSHNYAVGFVSSYDGVYPTITLPSGTQIQSIAVTNTTYAAVSMRDGDAYGKQFGANTAIDDETGDEVVVNMDAPDWFKLTVTGSKGAGVVGSVDFYLADYRFSDNSKDYIVSNWATVDLSSLSSATMLKFSLSSSDSSDWGMNTPSYFAVDNITVSSVPEPSTLALLCGVGVVAIIGFVRRKPRMAFALISRASNPFLPHEERNLSMSQRSVDCRETLPTAASTGRARYFVLTAIIAALAAARLLPHPANCSAVGAIALFGGAMFSRWRSAIAIPLAAMVLSDLALGLHATMPAVYSCFAINVWLGRWLQTRRRFVPIALATVAGSVQFFVITNFACWILSYPHTLEGFGACYAAAIPFFRHTLAGDAVFSALLFGGFALMEAAVPVLREQGQALAA
jgi:hypothetical protein